MKKILLNMIAIASTCCCLFKGAKNIGNKNVLEDKINVCPETEKLDEQFPDENRLGASPLRAITDPAEYPQYGDLDHEDDKFGSGQTIDPKWGEITGFINKNDGYEQFLTGCSYLDCDWYTFRTSEYRTYRIDFDTPSRTKSYVLKIYRYASADRNGIHLTLLKTMKGDCSDYFVANKVGTYYFQVSCANADDVVENGKYVIFYEDIKIDDPFELTQINKAKYKMAIWENDYIPECVDRWNGKKSQQYYKRRAAYNGEQITGTSEPIFQCANGTRFLDSVIYIWGKQELVALSKILNEIKVKVDEKFYNRNITSINLSLSTDCTSLVIGIVSLGLSESFVFASSIFGGVGILITLVSLINTISSTLAQDNNLSEFRDFINNLSEGCYWITEHNIEDAVICIPRYSYVTHTTTTKDRTLTEVRCWNFTYIEPDTTYREYYDFRDYSISNYQTIKNHVNETYHGKITPFKNGKAFMDHFGLNLYDYIDQDSLNLLDVSFVGNEPLYEQQLVFNSENNFVRYAKVNFQTGGDTIFFTRAGRSTKIEIYDEYENNLYKTQQGGGFGGNAFCSFNVTPYVTYLIKVTMTSYNQNIAETCYLDAIQSMTYDNNWNYKIPTKYSDIGFIDGGPIEGAFEFTKNKSTIIRLSASQTGNYLISTYYSELYHLIPLELNGSHNWGYYHRCDTGVLNVDNLNVDEEIPYMIVVARNDRIADIPSTGNLRSFGMMVMPR